MLSTDAFNYVNVLDKAADASWSRENILTNNIANVNTPGYKRKDLNFENTLKTELGRCKHESLDSKMKDVDLSRLNPSVYVDSSNYSYRLDGSNVIQKKWSWHPNRSAIRESQPELTDSLTVCVP